MKRFTAITVCSSTGASAPICFPWSACKPARSDGYFNHRCFRYVGKGNFFAVSVASKNGEKQEH